MGKYLNTPWLYKIIRIYNLFLAIIPSIAFYRATVQPDYNWGFLIIDGRGRSGDYEWLVFFMGMAWLVFALEVWYKKKWYYLLLILLFAYIPFNLVYGYVTGTEITFQGDAWQFKATAGLILLLISLFLLGAGCIWSWKDQKRAIDQSIRPLKNFWVFLSVIIMIGFLILVLFSQGRGGEHTIYDRVAVGITILQGLLLAHLIESSTFRKMTSL